MQEHYVKVDLKRRVARMRFDGRTILRGVNESTIEYKLLGLILDKIELPFKDFIRGRPPEESVISDQLNVLYNRIELGFLKLDPFENFELDDFAVLVNGSSLFSDQVIMDDDPETVYRIVPLKIKDFEDIDELDIESEGGRFVSDYSYFKEFIKSFDDYKETKIPLIYAPDLEKAYELFNGLSNQEKFMVVHSLRVPWRS